MKPTQTTDTVQTDEQEKLPLVIRALNVIEVVGNKLPNPFWLFWILAAILAVFSLALSLAAAPAVAPLIALFLGLLWPCFAAVMGDRKFLAPAALLAAGAILTAGRALIHP